MSDIVLTADRTLMSDYGRREFVGFAACSPKLLPDWLFHAIICPPVPHENGIALYASGGTRKMEAALLERGLM